MDHKDAWESMGSTGCVPVVVKSRSREVCWLDSYGDMVILWPFDMFAENYYVCPRPKRGYGLGTLVDDANS